MEPMDLLLLIPIGIIFFVNLFATVAVSRIPVQSRTQRIRRTAFIWLVPLWGAIVCLAYSSYMTLGFSLNVRSAGGGSGSQAGAAHGDGGSSGGGDGGTSGGGDGGGCSGGDGGGSGGGDGGGC